MKKITISDLSTYPTHLLIDSMPENYDWYKDSGLWSIRDNNTTEEIIVLSQKVEEDFEDFVRRGFIYFRKRYIGVFDIMMELDAKNYDYQQKLKTLKQST